MRHGSSSRRAERGEGPVYLVFVGRHFGVMGTGYTLNTSDELEPGWSQEGERR